MLPDAVASEISLAYRRLVSAGGGAIHCGRQHGVHCESVLGLRQIGPKQLAFF
jgi:hypothetical protein